MRSSRWLAFLRSQELGLLCGLATVVLLAIGWRPRLKRLAPRVTLP